MITMPLDYKVTVCDKCYRASCWHGVFMCEDAYHAGLIELPVGVLNLLHLEAPDHYSREKLQDVLGISFEEPADVDPDLCLVACRDGQRVYLATRQIMTAAQARQYVKTIASDRFPVIVHANRDFDLRPVQSDAEFAEK